MQGDTSSISYVHLLSCPVSEQVAAVDDSMEGRDRAMV